MVVRGSPSVSACEHYQLHRVDKAVTLELQDKTRVSSADSCLPFVTVLFCAISGEKTFLQSKVEKQVFPDKDVWLMKLRMSVAHNCFCDKA